MQSKGAKHNDVALIELSLRKPRRGVRSRIVAANAAEVYEIRPRKDGDGFDLSNDGLRYGPIWYSGPDAIGRAIAYAKFRSLSRSRRAMISVVDCSDTLIRTH